MTTVPSCGTQLMHLLHAYGVDTVFGMPGVHTLEAYRGIEAAGIRHVGIRHEQGAGFMADGYARISGRPGVCLLISGPGVTNAATPIGQAYSDSQPMLVLSSVAATEDLGMGRGRLHEITDQARVTEPLTAFSAVAHSPAQLRELVARAFAIFASQRPRPVHISIPLDVLKMPDPEAPRRRQVPALPQPDPAAVEAAAGLLRGARRPLIIAGGGGIGAAAEIVALAEAIGAAVVPTIAAKGVIPDSHPLALEATLERPQTQAFVETADVVLAIGTELAEPDLWREGPLALGGRLIRIDLDPAALTREYDVDVPILGDARATVAAIRAALGPTEPGRGFHGTGEIAAQRARERATLTPLERKHVAVLEALRRALPPEGVVFADMTQIVYTGYCYYPCPAPKRWIFPAGYGTLGFALPAAIGGQIAAPGQPTVALVGDGGFLFTLQELGTAVEQKLPLAVVLWNNDSLAQIRDGMTARGIPTIGVNQRNPDYLKLAEAFGCRTARPEGLAAFERSLSEAFATDGPTVIELREDAPFLP
ncbi:5-guanidino-2-oxopentanoate decarboxylase [Inquilinus sp. OTU3971]|uniref:5-guanidino-2-oxopentanoate decarboxylase n=1 Tax=Inquilinus sp. OTU3971 TaxID=3043855 RepID=UPI00313D3084